MWTDVLQVLWAMGRPGSTVWVGGWVLMESGEAQTWEPTRCVCVCVPLYKLCMCVCLSRVSEALKQPPSQAVNITILHSSQNSALPKFQAIHSASVCLSTYWQSHIHLHYKRSVFENMHKTCHLWYGFKNASNMPKNTEKKLHRNSNKKRTIECKTLAVLPFSLICCWGIFNFAVKRGKLEERKKGKVCKWLERKKKQQWKKWSDGGSQRAGLRVTDLLFDLSLTSKRPQTDMWLPSGLAYHAIIPAYLFLNVTQIVLLWLI